MRPTTAVPRVRRWMLPAAAAVLTLAVSACDGGGGTDPTPTSTAGTSAAATTGEDLFGPALHFYPAKVGATLNYANSGSISGTSTVTVDAVESSARGIEVTVTEVISGTGSPVNVKRTFVTSKPGGLSIDSSAFFAAAPGIRVTAAGDDFIIPPIKQLEAGQTGTGSSFVELTGPGFSGRNDVKYTVSGAGYASVTVPAGTVNAYVVKLGLDITSSFAGKTTGVVTYWFLPAFGLIKQETAVAGTKAMTQLTSTSVPLA